MKTKYFKVIVGVLTIIVVITLHLSISKQTNWDVLMQENIEALTSSELDDSSYYPCVRAQGYCIVGSVRIYGIALKK